LPTNTDAVTGEDGKNGMNVPEGSNRADSAECARLMGQGTNVADPNKAMDDIEALLGKNTLTKEQSDGLSALYKALSDKLNGAPAAKPAQGDAPPAK